MFFIGLATGMLTVIALNWRHIRNTILPWRAAGLACGMLAAAARVQAADNVVSVASTNGSSTLSWAIATSSSIHGGTPTVTFLSVTGDTNTSAVQFYRIGQTTWATNVNTTTSIPVQATNGFTAGDTIIIRHTTADTYEKRTLDTFATNNAVKVTLAPLAAVAAGDTIYRIFSTAVPRIPVGAVTSAISGIIYAGQRGYPIYAEVNGHASATLNLMTVQFIP
jgi:hypothetical protein